MFQLFLASRLIRWLGLSATLTLLPVGLIIGFGMLALGPTLLAAFIVQVLQRSASYGLLNPAREVLFTVVSREDKYKAKNFIDTAIFRAGDVAASRAYTALLPPLHHSGVAMLALPAAGVWAVVGWWLGREQRRIASESLGAAERPD